MYDGGGSKAGDGSAGADVGLCNHTNLHLKDSQDHH